MGLAMASNLQNYLVSISGLPLAYNNRTMSRGEPLAQLGAKPYSSVTDLVANCDLIFISLSDDAAVTQTITSLLTQRPNLSDKTIIDTSTVHPNTTAQLTTALTAAHAHFIAAPVFGATPVAEAGQLLFALAGPTEGITLAKPYIEACLARAVINVSATPRDATLLKTTGNFITAALAETVAEAHVFAEKAGLNAQVLEQLIVRNYGAYAGSISEKLTQGVYAPPKGERARSDIGLAVKDVGHGVESAREVGCRLEVAEVTLRRLEKAREWGAREGRALDSSAVYGVLRQEVGLGFEREDVLQRRTDA
ncbi:uncharacterized protein HMPREF1541_09874 [Cyphellophora europaea CBS 101466]|uniref:6-phosphogluconate dehydrogenase NADP-binding domain-containing protein n=1 Tax=Cyphellophora europaea (strain CBS 101466) TaxID=1220924 RepID=W2SAF0_CYPE1|nr:uncharacterized protein HMPREF1541_09874 [Cyphellophora europaea CBS 101466]ETN44998.1 hypothetical protein HMPREF1541_09874 [Cyphellophora europaea CBS 101466]